MATYAVNDGAGEFAAYSKTLVASTVDTVTFSQDHSEVRVSNDTGTFAIYVTVDGTNPTVGGAKTHRVPAFAGAFLDISAPGGTGTETVKLISSGTPTYSVVGG